MAARPQRRSARALVCLTTFLSLLGIGLAAPAHAASDTTPAVLHSLALASPGPFTNGDTVTLRWDATDDVGVKQVQVRLIDSAGKTHTVFGNDGVATGSTKVDWGWGNGTVKVQFALTYDVSGNYAWYYPSGRLSLQPGGESTHSVDMSQTFTTYGVGDLTPPTLTSMKLEQPGPFTTGDTVTLDWQATDEHGVDLVNFLYEDSTHKQHAFQAVGSNHAISLVIDKAWANGPVHLVAADVTDKAHNDSYYKPDGTATYKPSGSGPANHSFDFAAMAFATHDTGADTDPPVLSSISLRAPGPFVEKDLVTFDWTASDISGPVRVQLNLRDAADKLHALYAPGGQGTGSLTIDGTWAVGAVRLDSVTLDDSAGNSAIYYATGRMTSIPAGSTTHALDFSAVSFQVQQVLSVGFAATPGAFSGPDASFRFVVTDRQAAPEQVVASCTLDGSPQPCSADGIDLHSLPAGRRVLQVTVTDASSHRATSSFAWSVDLDAPSASMTAPSPAITLASQVLVRWSGTDAGSGVGSYDVRYASTDVQGVSSGWTEPEEWQGTVSTSAWSPSLATGRTYCFQVRARDRVGNLSAWSGSRCVTRPLDDSALTHGSGWTWERNTSLYGARALRSMTPAVTASLSSVRTRQIGVLATTCATCGVLGVYLNGQLVGQLSLAAPSTRFRQLKLLPDFGPRSGTVTVRVMSRGKPVVVDGLVLVA